MPTTKKGKPAKTTAPFLAGRVAGTALSLTTSSPLFAGSGEETALIQTNYADRSLLARYSDRELVRGGEVFHRTMPGAEEGDCVSILPSGHRGLGVSDRAGRTENTCEDVRRALLTGCPVLELDVRRAGHVLLPGQLATRGVERNELIICHTTPTEKFTDSHFNITPLMQVPTLREVVQTVANVYCHNLSHWKEKPPILQLELKGVEYGDLDDFVKECLITIISALNAIKVVCRESETTPLLAVDLLVTGNAENVSHDKTTGSEKLKSMLSVLIESTKNKEVPLPKELYTLFGGYLKTDEKKRATSRALSLSKAEFEGGLSCISHVGITGCIDTALAVGDGVDPESVRLGLDIYNVKSGAETTPAAIKRAKKYFDAGIGVDIGLFDVDKSFLEALAIYTSTAVQKPTLSLQATHCDFLEERKEPCGIIAGVARAVAIGKQSGCNIFLKTDRPDLISIALSLLHDLDEGIDLTGDRRIVCLASLCGPSVYEDMLSLKKVPLDSLTIKCQPVRWSRALDKSRILEKTTYLSNLSTAGRDLEVLLSGEVEDASSKRVGPR